MHKRIKPKLLALFEAAPDYGRVRPLKHGYTNQTVGDETTVEKRYVGPDASIRLRRELHLLTALQGQVPVPPVVSAIDGVLRLGFVSGAPGQDLMETGAPEAVLRSCGQILSSIHALPTNLLDSESTDPDLVIVHGDFGPNNLLLDPKSFEVTAVVDWEFARLGDPVEDLAWCEWIVRMHHPTHTKALDHFFNAYARPVPEWPDRQAAMVERCEELKAFCRRWNPDGPAVRMWDQRMAITEAWTA